MAKFRQIRSHRICGTMSRQRTRVAKNRISAAQTDVSRALVVAPPLMFEGGKNQQNLKRFFSRLIRGFLKFENFKVEKKSRVK